MNLVLFIALLAITNTRAQSSTQSEQPRGGWLGALGAAIGGAVRSVLPGQGQASGRQGQPSNSTQSTGDNRTQAEKPKKEFIGPKRFTFGENAYRDYQNAILQINFNLNQEPENEETGKRPPPRFNSTWFKADLFAVNNTIFGFEWKNDQFIRMPFPTYLQMHNTLNRQINGTQMLVPLYNRFRVRRRMANQMDCPLHVQVIGQVHYRERFNRIDLELRTPCHDDVLHRVYVNPAGLRETLRLTFGNLSYDLQFRTVVQGTLPKVTFERYTEVRQVRPIHHQTNYLERKFLDDYMANPGFIPPNSTTQERVTPRMQFQHEKMVLQDMKVYYDKIEQFFNSQYSHGPVGDKPRPIEANREFIPMRNDTYLRGNLTEEQRRQEQWASWGSYGTNPFEIMNIRHILGVQVNTLNEMLKMCQKICTPQEYYYSWSFCGDQCWIDKHFLSNTGSESDFARDVFRHSPWLKIGTRNLIIPKSNDNPAGWTWQEIQKIWQAPPVSSCKQSWTRFECALG